MNFKTRFPAICTYVLVTTLALLSGASANEGFYTCDIETAWMFNDDGSINKEVSDFWTEAYVNGDQTIINRASGKIMFGPLSGYSETFLIDQGSSSTMFKTLNRTGTDVTYFQVEEFAEGFWKPFMAIRGGTFFQGRCKK